MNNKDLDYKTAWNTIKLAFPILEVSSSIPDDDFEVVPCEALNIIKILNLTEQIQDLIISKIEERLRKNIVPKFWSHFKKTSNETTGFQEFHDAC
jgi:hypothetical protein